MIISDPFERLSHAVDSIPDELLFSIVFWIRTIFACIAFFFVVSIWDTLPAIPPVAEVVTTVEVTGTTANVNFTYRAQKMIDFEVHYELREMNSPILIHEHSQGRVEHALNGNQERFQKVFILDRPGYWCLDTSITWNNGLSLREHKQDLPQTCFNA